MWIIFRIGFALGAVLFKFYEERRLSGAVTQSAHGLRYISSRKKSKGRVVTTKFNVEVNAPCKFRLAPESRILHFLKRIGFGSEFQTLDLEFDQQFYIASDDPNFHHILKSYPELRGAFVTLARGGLATITCHGGRMRFEYAGDRSLLKQEEDACLTIATKLKENAHRFSKFDRTLPIAIILETLMFAAFGYAMGSFLELQLDESVRVLEPMPLFWLGLKVGVVSLLAWLALIYVFLRKSTRAALLISESLITAIVACIFVGPQATADINRGLDTSPPTYIDAVVSEKYSETRGSGKSRRTVFYLRFNDRVELGIGNKLKVSSLDYWRFNPPQKVRIRIHEGYLSAKYIADLEPGIPVEGASLGAQEAQQASNPEGVEKAKVALAWKAETATAVAKKIETTYWPNKQVRSLEPVVDGKKNGEGTYYHSNGKLYSRIPWLNDMKHGNFKLYRDDETLESHFNLKNGQPHGLMQWFDGAGKLIQTEVYFEGQLLQLSTKDRTSLGLP